MSADIDKERALFEAYYSNGYEEMNAIKRAGDGYALMQAHQAWIVWQARAAIPAEHQQRAPDENAHDIGMAHIICNEAGIPSGQILRRLALLSAKAADSARMDHIEKNAILGATYKGITSANIIVREGEWHELGLRAAIDAAKARATPQTAPSQANSEGDAP